MFRIKAQDILLALEDNLLEIRSQLGTDWAHFRHQMIPLRLNFAGVADDNALEEAIEPLWQICWPYSFIKNLILRYSGQREECERKGKSGGTDHEDEISIPEIINRFQSLLTRVAEMEPLARSDQ